MSVAPEVSVVMGVCDGGPTLTETLSSVFGQHGVTFDEDMGRSPNGEQCRHHPTGSPAGHGLSCTL